MKKLVLPTEILVLGQSLEHLGLNEVAWPRRAAFQVIELLRKAGDGILGGDVYRLEQGSLVRTFDGWHCDPLHEESEFLFASRSCQIAWDYVTRYRVGYAQDDYFVIVPRREVLKVL